MAGLNPALEESIVIDFITSAATGAAADADALPTAQTFEDSTDTDLAATTVTKRVAMTGNYRCLVACTAANGFEAGKSYNVVISATVGGIAAKAVIGTFQVRTRQIDNLAFPTVSGRSLDVSATGEAGIDWANVGSPTTALDLSGTSTKALEPTVDGRTLDVSATGEADANVATWLGAAPAALSANGYVQAILLRWLTDNAAGTPSALISGRLDANAQAVANGVIAAASFAASAIDAAALAADAANEIADALLDRANGIETGYTLRQTLRLIAAVVAANASGGPGSSVFRNLPNTANRVASVATADGNRTTTLTP